MSADRIFAQFPLSDSTGYSATEIVAAIEGGKAVTYERSRKGDAKRTTPTFVWSDQDVALSVAMSNAGFGHMNARLMHRSQDEVTARMDAAAAGEPVTTMLFIGVPDPRQAVTS